MKLDFLHTNVSLFMRKRLTSKESTKEIVNLLFSVLFQVFCYLCLYSIVVNGSKYHENLFVTLITPFTLIVIFFNYYKAGRKNRLNQISIIRKINRLLVLLMCAVSCFFIAFNNLASAVFWALSGLIIISSL